MFTLFDPAGPIAAVQSHLIVEMVLLMLVIVIPMFITVIIVARKYRAGNVMAKYDPELKHPRAVELIMWVIPACVVAALGVLAWNTAHEIDPYREIQSSVPQLEVQVVALPWKWLFIYPKQGIATVNFLEFPKQTPVHFTLTADGPISSFWIPRLGSQIYAMGAMQTQLSLVASTTGDYLGKDTEINGDGYAGMTFDAKSVTAQDFDAWVKSVQAGSATLDGASYAALATPSENNPVAYYAATDPSLYSTIVMKYMMPMGAMPTSQATTTSNIMSDMQGMQM